MTSYKAQLKNITTFIFDVDGVFTNGEVLLMNGDIYRTFHSKDVFAIQYAAKMGYQMFIITGGNSEEVKNRLTHLGIKEVFLKSGNKLEVYEKLKSTYNLNDSEVLYMGDDIPDYDVMKKVSLAAAPQDACPEIKSISQYISPIYGGKGCVRDIIEQTLKSQNKWFLEEAKIW